MSPSLLAAAPHRLLFFAGAANVLLAMLWWTLWLVDARVAAARACRSHRFTPDGCTRS